MSEKHTINFNNDLSKDDSHIFLVSKAKKGDVESFIRLCESYQDVLYNSAYKILLNKEDVADCIQETEIRAWNNIKKLRKDSFFDTWLFRIMINVAKDILKTRNDTVNLEDKKLFTEDDSSVKQEISDALLILPEKYRIPIILYYYTGFSVKEISYELKLPQSTVKTRLSRGRNRLKKILGGNFDG